AASYHNAMSNKRIAFQGEPGAYSEEALYLLHPDAASQPQREFRDVADAVLAGRADYGLLPIENSLVGSVATNFDLIAESGLAVAAERIEDEPHNQTRFLLVAREPVSPAPGVAAKTTLRLKLPHRPGTLARALAPFADAGLNLTKLESRPDRATPWQYLFYLDV